MSKVVKENTKRNPYTLSGILLTKDAYKQVASEFHPFHRHDLNVVCHLLTTGLGVWGAVQLALTYGMYNAVYAYAAIIALTTPTLTSLVHTAMIAAMTFISSAQVENIVAKTELLSGVDPLYVCIGSIVIGYAMQDVSHWVWGEKTYMGDYMSTRPLMIFVHSLWLLPLVIDSILMRYCFLPKLFVARNRNVVETVTTTGKKACDDLAKWVADNVDKDCAVTTHVWPHRQDGTTGPCTALEDDAAIYEGFRKVFAAKHYDVKPIQGMNEIYVTAVGAKKEMNSDAVFYTPHTDGPYWFLPGASCYRVLVGLTPNTMVRTNFNLQHESFNQVLDKHGALGFDYNRELHWIDHVPGETNKERRSVLKLHYVVYPKGWHWYGNLCASLNTNYNTWARGNFLKTLRPSGMYDFVLAWWIWLTTWTNQAFEKHIGWYNLVYIAAAYAAGPTPFLILTSFRHYMTYICTFAFRTPAVAHGYLMRDAKLYKTLALLNLAVRLLPLVKLPEDIPGLLLACMGYGTTILATVRLGFVRTYFGSELGFVKPKWINGFPYGYIPHPMIVGQLFAYSSILFWFNASLSLGNRVLIGTHMTFYIIHMVQEMLFSSY